MAPAVRERCKVLFPKGLLAAYLTVFAVGAMLIKYFIPALAGSDVACGREAAALFVPYGCAATMIVVLVLTNSFSRAHVFFTFCLCLLLGAFFQDVFFHPVWHYYFDDPGRYSNYAKFMLREHTLWGADAVGGLGENSPFYVDQPGYRYFLALMMTLAEGENRLMQLMNMSFYLAVVLGLLLEARRALAPNHFYLLAAFLALSLPYAANNICEGLSEWLAVAVCFAAVWSLMARKTLAAVALLAIAPFVRQNLILTSLLVFVFVISRDLSGRGRVAALVMFCSLVCLPVLHNFVFADEWRFFSTNRGATLNWNLEIDELFFGVIGNIKWKALNYLGYYPTADSLRTIQALMFAPLGSALLVYWFFRLTGRVRWWYLGMVAVTIGPVILYGWGYFPRFVFASQAILLGLASYLSLEQDNVEAARSDIPVER